MSGKGGKGFESVSRLGKTRLGLNNHFVSELLDDFRKHGKAAIKRVREREPAAYLRLVAGFQPKDVAVSVGVGAGLVDLVRQISDERQAGLIDVTPVGNAVEAKPRELGPPLQHVDITELIDNCEKQGNG